MVNYVQLWNLRQQVPYDNSVQFTAVRFIIAYYPLAGILGAFVFLRREWKGRAVFCREQKAALYFLPSFVNWRREWESCVVLHIRGQVVAHRAAPFPIQLNCLNRSTRTGNAPNGEVWHSSCNEYARKRGQGCRQLGMEQYKYDTEVFCQMKVLLERGDTGWGALLSLTPWSGSGNKEKWERDISCDGYVRRHDGHGGALCVPNKFYYFWVHQWRTMFARGNESEA